MCPLSLGFVELGCGIVGPSGWEERVLHTHPNVRTSQRSAEPQILHLARQVGGAPKPRPSDCFASPTPSSTLPESLRMYHSRPYRGCFANSQVHSLRSVGFGVPQTLERFELWGACEELSLPGLPTQRFHGLARRTQRTRDIEVYTGSGHCCGVIPYSSVVVVDCLEGLRMN